MKPVLSGSSELEVAQGDLRRVVEAAVQPVVAALHELDAAGLDLLAQDAAERLVATVGVVDAGAFA
jgi:hypothetical protein